MEDMNEQKEGTTEVFVSSIANPPQSLPAAVTAAWQLHIVRSLSIRAKPSLLRTHIETLLSASEDDGVSDEAAAMWTISHLSFVEFVNDEMKRPGRLMCADQESVIWEMLSGNKRAAKNQTATTTTNNNQTAAADDEGVQLAFSIAAPAVADPAGATTTGEVQLSDPTAVGETTRIHLHPDAISRWIAKHGSLSWECSPFEVEKVRFAFFWILTALLHNRHNYDLQERKHTVVTAPSPTPSSKSSDAPAAVTVTSNAYSNATRRRYEVDHAPRSIFFPKDDPTGSIRATFVQQRVALLQKTLLPHQVREITWIVSLERMIGRDPTHRTSWTRLSTQDCTIAGLPRTFYVHSNARVAELRIDCTAPASRRITVAGGALGSETGLGKTISLLALVWLEAEESALRWVEEDQESKSEFELVQADTGDEEGDVVMTEDVKPKVQASAKSRATAAVSPKPSKTVRSKAMKPTAAAAAATSVSPRSVSPRRSSRPTGTAATAGTNVTKKAGSTKKATKKSRTTKVVRDETEAGEESDDNMSDTASVVASVASVGSVASKVSSASTKGRRAKAGKKGLAVDDEEVEELDSYIPASRLQRVKATLLISPNQTFMQHVTKARTTLPPSCVVVAIADKAQYLRTTAADLQHADLVIISTEFFSNALLREVMDYDRELLAESAVKRARRLSQPPSKKARAVRGRWHFHRFAWFRLVLDEAHEVGSPLSAKRSYATPILSLSSCFRWYVSATFPHGSPDELRFAMQFLQLRVDGQTVSELEEEYRGTTLKEAFVPSMEDICIFAPTPVSPRRVTTGKVDDPPVRAAPVSYGRSSFMLTATAAALRQLFYRDLYFRSTKARVRKENPQLNLFRPLRRQLIIVRTNTFERLRHQFQRKVHSASPASEPGSMSTLLHLFPGEWEWHSGGAALFFVQKLIHGAVEYLKLLHGALGTNAPVRHLRIEYSCTSWSHNRAKYITDQLADDIRRSNESKVARGLHWSSSLVYPCLQCRKINCETEYIDIFPDYSWTAMWRDPVGPGLNVELVWKSVSSQDFESHRNMDEALARSQPMRRDQQSLWQGNDNVMTVIAKKIQIVEDLKDVLRAPYPVTSEQLARLDSVMKREYSDDAERGAMASCVRMAYTDGKFVPPAWVELLMNHFRESLVAPRPLAELVTDYFVGGDKVAPSMLRWAAQQTSLVVAALVEIHRILHEDWHNHRIVLFATHTVDLASLLQWLALLMPQVSVARGGVNIHSKTKAIQAFERSPTPSVVEGMEDMEDDEEEEKKSSATSPSPTVSKKRKRSDDSLEDFEYKSDDERSVSASSAATGSRSASPSVGGSRLNPASVAAQIIAFTSDHGSSGIDLTVGTHLLCVDRWDQSSAAVREASHRIFKQLEGRVDRLTQATKPIIIRLVQDTPATWIPFVDSF